MPKDETHRFASRPPTVQVDCNCAPHWQNMPSQGITGGCFAHVLLLKSWFTPGWGVGKDGPKEHYESRAQALILKEILAWRLIRVYGDGDGWCDRGTCSRGKSA